MRVRSRNIILNQDVHVEYRPDVTAAHNAVKARGVLEYIMDMGMD